MSASPALTLPQQFARFLFVGCAVFVLAFWLLTSILMPVDEIRRDQLSVHLIIKTFPHQSTEAWFRDLQTGYLPFFLSQRSLVVAYSVAVQLAWFVAFLFDTKILRREKTIL
jgi:hypothetical protein